MRYSDQFLLPIALATVLAVFCLNIQSCLSADEPISAQESPAAAPTRCLRGEGGDCVEDAKRLIKRAIGCESSDPFMDCLGKRNFAAGNELGYTFPNPRVSYVQEAPLKRAIGCEMDDPFMDCLGKRGNFEAEKRAIDCDMSDPFMDCLGKRAAVPVAVKPAKKAIGCGMSDPFMNCLGKRGFKSFEPEKRAIGCAMNDPFMDCLGKRGLKSFEPEKRAIGCGMGDPFMDCLGKK